MLLECFEKIGNNVIVRALRSFLHSVWYIVFVALLMVCSNVFSLEVPVFFAFLVLGLLVVLFDDDLKGVIPVCCCAYMSTSYANNPSFNVGSSVFYDPAFKLQLIFIIVVAVIALGGRLITLIVNGEKKKKMPRLTIGFLALGAALVLGGLFSSYYDLRTAFFGFVILASLCGLYFLFYYGVKWKETKIDYFAYLFMIIGLALFFEIIGIYVLSDFFKPDALYYHDRAALQTGWGMYNNIGCVLAMSIPAALYLAATKKHGWAYMIASLFLAFELVISQSRNSMLFGGCIYGVGLIIALVKSSKRERIFNLIVLGVALALVCAGVIVLAVVFREKMNGFFSSMMKLGFFSDNSRFNLYRDGLVQFTEEPFLGIGFYQCKAFRWGNLSENAFLPPRYHNTVLQMLISCGVFGLVCYLFHRFQTVWMLFRRPTMEKTFIALCISGLLLTSLVECHFFSFGPGMLYAVLLACAEGSDIKRKEDTSAAK